MVAMFATGNVQDVESVVHPDYVDHQGLGDRPMSGQSGFTTVVHVVRRDYEVLEVTVQELLDQRSHAAARLRWRGVRPSGELSERETLEIIDVSGDRAIEHWGGHS